MDVRAADIPTNGNPDYYLMSIWAINYGVGSIVGLAIYGLLEWKFDLAGLAVARGGAVAGLSL